MAASSSQRFGPDGRYDLRAHERRLLVAGIPVALGGRAFDLLLALAERPGELRTKRELLDRVWPGVAVEENNLVVQIGNLRKVLGGAAIVTIAGRGYCFAPLPGDASPVGSSAASAGAGRLHADPPEGLQPLLGRAAELCALAAMMRAHRLVTLVGAGGIGKSSLARALMPAQRDAHPGGVCWVDVAGIESAASLLRALALALGAHASDGDPVAGLRSALVPPQMLVALDNAEHLLAASAHAVRVLLERAPGLRFIVTSQAALKLPAEGVYRVGALAVPPRPLPARQALQFGAVALFVERASAAGEPFELTDANTPTLVDICRALDGNPLAIELAAERLPMLGLRRLAVSMGDRLKLLTVNANREAPARQQSLRAALDWSHGLLGAAARAVFRRLAVLPGDAALALIQQVVADSPGAGALDDWSVLDALGVLVDRSLITLTAAAEGSDAEPCYGLRGCARLYALERLHQAGEHEMLCQRLALATAAWQAAAPHKAPPVRAGGDVDGPLSGSTAAALFGSTAG